MHLRCRKLLLTTLIAAFAGQTTLVYGDDTAASTRALDSLALRGRQLWLEHNCQSCHQLHGFGGFLGADLTNAASWLTRERLDLILTEGAGQMPAFGFTSGEIEATVAFLEGMDGSGVGQARRLASVPRATVSQALEEEAGAHPLSESAARGLKIFGSQCTACHTLLQAKSLGPFMAPDLSTVAERLNGEQLHQVMTTGNPLKGMPPTGRSKWDRDDLIEFFVWLAEHREALAKRVGIQTTTTSIPWFEFR